MLCEKYIYNVLPARVHVLVINKGEHSRHCACADVFLKRVKVCSNGFQSGGPPAAGVSAGSG